MQAYYQMLNDNPNHEQIMQITGVNRAIVITSINQCLVQLAKKGKTNTGIAPDAQSQLQRQLTTVSQELRTTNSPALRTKLISDKLTISALMR